MQALHSEGMDFLRELICCLECEYGIHVTKVRTAEDEDYILETRKDKLIARKSGIRETDIIYICSIFDYIKERGFDSIVKLYKTMSGKGYINTSKGFYILSDYIDNKGQNIFSQGREYDMVRLLAAFHSAAQGYSPPRGGTPKTDWGKWTEKYKKQQKDLKKHVSNVNDKIDKSPFDEFFLETSSLYLDRMEQSIKMLKKGNYLDTVEDSMKKRQMCMGSIKQSNVVCTKSGLYIKSLHKCRYDIVERDIAELLQKLIEYKKEGEISKLKNLIYVYNSKNTLNKNSIALIKAFILFPEEYEKICSRYYKARDKWTEKMYIDRLKGALDLEKRKMELCDALGCLSINEGEI